MAELVCKLNSNELIEEILSLDTDRMKVVVLIGENGVGKSTLLAQFAERLVEQGRGAQVIAISNTPHDKFSRGDRAVHYLGQRDGNRYASEAIKESLRSPRNEIATRVRKLAEVLELMGYERVIGLALENFNPHVTFDSNDSHVVASSVTRKVASTVRDKLVGTTTPVVWLNLDNHEESRTGASFAPSLLSNEETLVAIGVCSGIRIILRKPISSAALDKREVDLQAASSGEISYLSTMAWASSKVSEHCVLLIDEPENSLHPKWQVRYIQCLQALFRYERPLVVIASHSPLLLAGEESGAFDILPYKIEEGRMAYAITTIDSGLEGVSWAAFGTLPSNNQYLSGLLIDLINQYCRDEISFDQALLTMDNLIGGCVGQDQREVIDAFKDALRIASNDKQKH
ncbi:ArgK protein [Paraburkholderia bryophila]|uniref:ArgK protein n=2 Tax=Paraburkholderia bryophila TaxID=420952 RepID=A0A329CTC6_9BURK|nr:ArgK protein [Paraburkholderia bryophila]